VSEAGRLVFDVGSSRIKAGWYALADECPLDSSTPQFPIAAAPLAPPEHACVVAHRDRDLSAWTGELRRWLERLPAAVDVWLATVHPAIADRVDETLADVGGATSRRIALEHVPLSVRVEYPARVGVDRLLNAVAVNQIRAAMTPAIVIDAGTAVTVDLVDAEGGFAGGAILPGLMLASGALHRGTAQLPQLGWTDAQAPLCVGKSTLQAIASGVYWGLVGGLAELVRRFEWTLAGPGELYLTGGDGPALLTALGETLGRRPRYVPHLVLAGALQVARVASGRRANESPV
jgi:pantothenate kinase type III